MSKAVILVIDDAPANLKVLFDHLRQSGFQVRVGQNGEAALEQVKLKRPDLILLDVKLPGIDGFETCRRLKAEPSTHDIPILFMTVVLETVDKVRGFEVGAVDYIAKPIEVAEVEARIRTHLKIRDLQARLEAEKARLEEEMRSRERAEAALIQTKQWESLGVLAGGLAHDVNNILTGILGTSSLALGKLGADDPSRRAFETINRLSDRAADLADQLLIYSGGGNFRPEPCWLGKLIEGVVPLLRSALASKKIRIDVEFDRSLPPIEADAGQIKQMIMNLVTNAVEATGEGGGEVYLGTSLALIGPEDTGYWAYTGTVLPPGQYGLFEIRDRGVGMPEATKARMFHPFFTTQAARHGLGLSVVLGIVKNHQGGIHVESVSGVGTTFRVALPLAQEPVESQPIEDVAQPTEAMPAVVLIIDDEESVRETLVEILEGEGIAVLTAAEGLEGIAIYRDRGLEIDLVLLDSTMPGLSGVETLHELRRINPQVPVLFSSGYQEAQAREWLAGEPSVPFLRKPYSAAKLLEAVSRALREQEKPPN